MCYDPSTGSERFACNGGGYLDNTTWARGQAWAVYGASAATHDPSQIRGDATGACRLFGLGIEAPWLVHGGHGASLTEHKAGGVFDSCAGFTMVYRYTRHQPHLVTALKLADFFVERMGAAFPDHVPNFDLTCQSAHPVVAALVWLTDVCGCS